MQSALRGLYTTTIPPNFYGFTNYYKNRALLNLRKFQTQSCKFSSNHEKQIVQGRAYLPPWFSVAPMMEWTDNHFRTLARIISKHAWLYTEMVVAETIVHQKDNLDRFLAFPAEQHPIVLQIGGSNIDNLSKATELASAYSYDEINLNCGCPSGKVAGHGCFGARLMLDPEFVGDAMSAIAASCSVPVSVKCRIGVDDHDSYEELCKFVDTIVSKSPTRHFIIHARKALLNGISPAANRRVPPLKYEYYYGLLRDFPEVQFTLNGGVNYIEQVNVAMNQGAHGVMVGRAAYNNPWSTLGYVDSVVYGVPSDPLSRRQVLEKYQIYADSVVGKDAPNRPNVRQLVKPLLNMFHSEPGNGLWKRKADAALRHCKTVKSFLEETIDALPNSVLDSQLSGNPPKWEGEFGNMDLLLPPKYAARTWGESKFHACVAVTT
ncbi:tRNA-dihydrouridine(47) synthase [Carex littledalei]|uniref:tRNA-dihydrouridine(47) synthase n=1 Tax=Carex littledalei TaxID=544730 RepID=A0A833QSI9_9POAL|nr:tRNA-dihydrouridine(47) synthase [Carex littledalei]